ncbi:MAG: DNA-directed RNA polymerase subunit P [Candidatus Aenigmarchaeota archaeon]|nr:DNA-directed RNA polymerase subunit P [Candidatus Aenigmarchaeota archaeon]
MGYKCLNCGSDINADDIKKRVRCPFCGHRIIRKRRSVVNIRKVPAV